MPAPEPDGPETAAHILAAPGNPLLRWNSPLSEPHADLLIESAGLAPHGRVLDLGCGWAELLMRFVSSAPDAVGDGVDTDPDALARGERLARERDLDQRIHLHRTPAAQWHRSGYQVAVCVGATHAWPDSTTGALRALRAALAPGGRALLGEGYWTRPPTRQTLDGLGATADELGPLDALVRAAADADLRTLQVTTADQREWDLFESNSRAGWGERWALENPGHPLRDEVLAIAGRHREGYLGGYRGGLGFAYLVLAAS